MSLEDELAALTASFTGGAAAQGPAPRYVGGLVAPPRYQPANPRQADRQYAYDNQFTPYVEDDLLAPGAMAPEDIAMLQEQMRQAGLYPKNGSYRVGRWDEATIDAYERVLAHANRNGVPDRIALRQLRESPEMGGDGKLRGAGGQDDGPFVGTRRQTSTRNRLTDPTSARAIIRSTLRERLGRAPSAEEYSAFIGALSSAEQANPIYTTDSATYTPDGQGGSEVTSSTSMSTGGLDPGGFAEEYAQAGSLGTEANTFKVEGDFYNAAMQAISGRGLLDG